MQVEGTALGEAQDLGCEQIPEVEGEDEVGSEARDCRDHVGIVHGSGRHDGQAGLPRSLGDGAEPDVLPRVVAVGDHGGDFSAEAEELVERYPPDVLIGHHDDAHGGVSSGRWTARTR